MPDMSKPDPSKNPPMAKPVSPAPVGGAPPKRGLGRILFLLILIVGTAAAGHMGWHGKKMGEERAIKENPTISRDEALAKAQIVWPWTWSTDEWKKWRGEAVDDSATLGAELTEKAKAAKAKTQKWLEEHRAKKAATPTTTVPTDPKTATPPTTPDSSTNPKPADPANTAPAGGPPEGYAEAAKLVEEASDLLFKDNKKSREKFEEAIKKLEPMAAKQPVHPDVAHALEVSKQSVQAIDESTPR